MCFRDHSLLLISYLTLNALVSFFVNGDNNKVIIRFELVHICGVLKIVSSTFLWLSSQSYRNRDFSKCLLYNSLKIKKKLSSFVLNLGLVVKDTHRPAS